METSIRYSVDPENNDIYLYRGGKWVIFPPEGCEHDTLPFMAMKYGTGYLYCPECEYMEFYPSWMYVSNNRLN